MKTGYCFALAAMLSFASAGHAASSAEEAMVALQDEWAVVNYQTNGEEKAKRFTDLVAKAEQSSKDFPDSAEVRIWQGIILSTAAGTQGGLDALSLVKESRATLEKAIEINPDALHGSAYTSLGALYYKVPSWPIAFGSNKKARGYLEQALTKNPDGMDPNYFYADLLFEDGDYKEALAAVEKADQAPARPGREVADQGRRTEIAALKSRIMVKLGR